MLSDILRELPVTSEFVKEETSKDELLTNISKFIKTSWPNEIKNQIVKALSESEGIIILSDRIVIPFSLQKIILKQLHSGHPGIVRMKALARSYVYWPNIDQHIADYVKRCSNCSKVLKSPTKVHLQPWPDSTKP